MIFVIVSYPRHHQVKWIPSNSSEKPLVELIHPLGYFDFAQIKRHFSAYRHEYNQTRPHQALG
ncbi:MAG: transposase [Bdellovibrionales bacterium]|nr:transposase [Bdellovibrionales bacterium]